MAYLSDESKYNPSHYSESFILEEFFELEVSEPNSF